MLSQYHHHQYRVKILFDTNNEFIALYLKCLKKGVWGVTTRIYLPVKNFNWNYAPPPNTLCHCVYTLYVYFNQTIPVDDIIEKKTLSR